MIKHDKTSYKKWCLVLTRFQGKKIMIKHDKPLDLAVPIFLVNPSGDHATDKIGGPK